MLDCKAKLVLAASFSLFTIHQANACTVAGAVTLAGVLTDGAGHTIDNLGTVSFSTQTRGLDSGITNAGSIGLDVLTSGDNSGVDNAATGVITGIANLTGNNSTLTNSGTISTGVFMLGADSTLNLQRGPHPKVCAAPE